MKMKRRAILPVLFAFIGGVFINAQSIWTSAELKYGVIKKLDVSLEGEYRTFDNVSGTERVALGLGFDYKLSQYFKAGAQYKFLYRHVGERTTSKGNLVEDYWQPRQRFSVSFTGQYKWNKFKFSLRERYQLTHNKAMSVAKYDGDTGKQKDDEEIEAKTKNVLRSRLKVDYSISKRITPYVSAELYNNLDGFSYDKSRFTIGSEFKINKHNTIEAYYRYIDRSDNDESSNVIGVGYQYKF